jgi:hypothetical protein
MPGKKVVGRFESGRQPAASSREVGKEALLREWMIIFKRIISAVYFTTLSYSRLHDVE